MSGPPLAAPPAPLGTRAGARPTISVIIAVYQAAALVPDAVRSALEQTVAAHEVIVCDDGSTDDPAGALAPFRDQITLLRQENRGEAGARNTAAHAASGDFLAILDADDVFFPERIEALGEALAARPDLDILTTDAWIELDGRRVRRVYDGGYTFPIADQRAEILRGNFIFGICAVRRQALLDAGGYDESIKHATDWDLWLRLIAGGATAGCLPTPLAAYRLQRGSLSSQRARMLAGRVQILEKATARDDLSTAERVQLAASLRDYRARLALARAREALIDRRPGARRLALTAALGRGQGVPTRIKLAAGVLAPRMVARVLRSRPVETTAGLLVAPGGAPTDREAARPSAP